MKMFFVTNCLGHEIWINAEKVKYITTFRDAGLQYTRIHLDDSELTTIDGAESMQEVIDQLTRKESTR